VLLLIDNYDSFTYNLVQAFAELGAEVTVRRNDAIDEDQACALGPSHIVLSPGPGRPEEAGITVPLVRAAAGRCIPVLGVCLGHQAIAVAYGGVVRRGAAPVHGKTSPIDHDSRGVFAGLAQGFMAGRYHSLVVADEMPPDLEVAARVSGGGPVMGVRHRVLPVHGVQFHPESILTESGRRLLANFLAMAGPPERGEPR
jgi:anthranilate synthase/aminodeoxychorismate synthase-like glutamine amidotransferase